MAENKFQLQINEYLRQGYIDQISLSLSDNKLAVIITIGEQDAAYTADEAREVADGLRDHARQDQWEINPSEFCRALRALAGVIDGEQSLGRAKIEHARYID